MPECRGLGASGARPPPPLESTHRVLRLVLCPQTEGLPVGVAPWDADPAPGRGPGPGPAHPAGASPFVSEAAQEGNLWVFKHLNPNSSGPQLWELGLGSS